VGENTRILIIDDDENIRQVLMAILTDEGYDVESVGTGKEALERTKREFFNAALIDVRLPDIEGIELLTKFKPTSPRMRKIIITGYPTLQNAIQAVNGGANAYIMKPFDVEKVLKIIQEQLRKQENEKRFNQDMVADFIETRVRELDVNKITWKTEKS
jgi:DNA-binding NtrC family response regulator